MFARPDGPDYEPLGRVAGPARAAPPPARAAAAAPAGGPVRPRPPVLDRGPDFDLDYHVRHTAVAPPGRRRAARRAGRPHRRPPARPPPPAVGDLRHRGPARRPLRHPHQGPPRHRRRGVGRRAAHDDAGRRPGGRSDRAARRGLARPSRRRATARCCSGPRRASSASRPRGLVLGAQTVRQFGQATRNPALVAAADQLRSSLRGPLGTVLNIGRQRDPGAEAVGPLPRSAPRTPLNARSARTAASPSARRRCRTSRRSRTPSARP